MKKSQRLRLADLKKKDAATLSVEEKSELQRLEALAVQHPDASKDEDDTKLTAQSFVEKLTAAFTEKATLAAENKKLTARVAELEAAAAAKPAPAAGAGADATALSAAVEARVAAEGKLAVANTFIVAMATLLGVKADDLTAKGDAGLKAAFTARVDVRAGEKLAELGFPASGIPSNSKDAAGGTTSDILAQYAKITDASEAARFYAQNISPLLAPKTN